MERVKNEINVEADEELIDVGGDQSDSDIQQLVAGADPTIIRSRFRRPRRQADAPPQYTQYSRRLRNRALSAEIDPNFEEIEIVNEVEGEDEDRQLVLNQDIEMEIESDVKLIQSTRDRGFSRNEVFEDFGSVKFKFDSTQRKKQVIVYNSVKFPGHASEWYFARRNNTTANETYRCVQCRRYREESKKGIRVGVEDSPEARIVVQNGRFLTDPDDPLGKHICDFENNDRTTLQSVWCRRALSKANSELRLRPEKPKEKFNQLLREIQCGKDYAHLPVEVRQEIINELDSKKGFASRRRSFARNNRYGQTQYTTGIRTGAGVQTNDYGDIMYYLCGMENCTQRFTTPDERTEHRNYFHRNVLFIDTKEELDEYNNYRRLHGNVISGDELVVANEQIVLEDQIKNEPEHYEVVINDEEGENFYTQSSFLLESLRESSIVVLNDPAKREAMLNLLTECDRACKELAQSVDETAEAQSTVQPESEPDNAVKQK